MTNWFNYAVHRKVNVVCLLGYFLTFNTFSRPVLDEVHFLRLRCNPASPSEKHVTESRARKTLFRVKYFRIMCTTGGLGRHIGRDTRQIVDRWSTDISTDCRLMHRPICSDQLPVKYRSSIGQVSVKYRSSIGQASVKHRPSVGQVSIKYRTSIGSLTDHIAQKKIG